MARRISMKMIPVVGLLGALGATCSAPASASNVTMYGYFDMGYIKESGKDLRMGRGQNNWLGFMGKEDLGGGTFATFNLQTRFDPTNGMLEKPSTYFQGESTVGFTNSVLGGIRFGRAMTPLWAKKWVFDPWYDSTLMGSLGNYNGDFNSNGVDATDGDYHNYSRVSGAVFYSSPNMSGFTVHAEAETEKPELARSRSVGVSVNYENGPLTSMLAYEKNHNADEIAYIASSWKFDKLTVLGSYSYTDKTQDEDVRSMMLAGNYAIGADKIRFGYGRIRGDSHKNSIGYNHALSKRTNLYADIYREKVKDDSMNGVALGMNHTF